MDATGYEQDQVSPELTGDSLKRLSKLAEKQSQAELEVEKAKEALQKAQDALLEVAEKQIPELMEELGLSQFKTLSGLEIEIQEKIRTSIAKKNEAAAFSWLRKNGNEKLIRNQVNIVLGTGQDEIAQQLCEMIEARGLVPEKKSSVHAQTLAAFVRDQLEKGTDLPMDVFGVYRQRFSKIK